MNRWFRLAGAVVAMIMIANLQYAWTFFVKPLRAAHHWPLDDVQFAYGLFIAFETWVMPCSGWLIDRLGPRAFMSLAGVMCGAGWAMMGHANTLAELYLFYGIAGFGAALVYCGSMGIALKWFPDRRGLAAGLIAAGFGAGSALFTRSIANFITSHGFQAAFLYTGIGQGLVILIAAQFLRNPEREPLTQVAARGNVKTHGPNFNSFEMLQTPHFYMLFAMALMMGIGGLMITGQIAPMGDSMKIAASAITLSVQLNLIANGGGRLFWGWVSDHIGRERTMCVAFFMHAAFLLGIVTIGKGSTTLFLTFAALVYFTWGEIYSLMPSAVGDYFGARNASSNYGFIYAAKGVAAIFASGFAAKLFKMTGSWDDGFYACAALALVAALMTLILMRMSRPRKPEASASASEAVAVGG